MCRKYRNIKHPALLIHSEDAEIKGMCNYFDYYTPSSLVVGCGICYQCQQIKQKEWQLRLRYELEYANKNGYVFKDELTYSPDKVCKIGSFMVFNKEHVQTFLTKLRVYLKRHYKDTDVNTKFKYFVACEYGGHFTHRPHYHLLLFIYDKQVNYLVLNRLVQKAWIYGYTNQNKGRNRKPNWSVADKKVQSVAGVEYVTKYLFKDRNFIDGLINQYDKCILDYLCERLNMSRIDFLKHNLLNDKFFAVIYSLLIKSPFKDSIPFKMQSQGIGKCLLEHISFDDACRGLFNDIHTSKLEYLPLYYKRKLLYDYNRTTKCFVKNENYIKFLWQQKSNELNDNKHSLLADYPQLPNSLQYTYNSFPYSPHEMFVLNDFYKFLNSVCPTNLKVNIPKIDAGEIIYIYRCLFPLLEKRDLFYSSLLRCTFNVNQTLTFPEIEVFEIEAVNIQLKRFLIEPHRPLSDLTMFFVNLENWNRQSKEEIGEYICKSIHEQFIADKYKYD